jgi:hypothetical protein
MSAALVISKDEVGAFRKLGTYKILLLKLLRPLLRLRERNWKQILAFTIPNRLPSAPPLSFVCGSPTLASILPGTYRNATLNRL